MQAWWLGKTVVLWTDALLYLLLALVLSVIWQARRLEYLRASWREVKRSRLGMASAVILGFYAAIALLDSMHFHPRLDAGNTDDRYSPAVLSVFDVMLTPLREHQEETYSAPFATHSFMMKVADMPDGVPQREYPRLRYGGLHLVDVSQRAADVLRLCITATVQALALWLAVAALAVALLARLQSQDLRTVLRTAVRGDTETPWRVVLVTLLVLTWMTLLAVHLGTKYHVVGTDKVGQDVLYQVLKSIRTGLLIGTLTTLVMLPLAIMFGIMAGYFRGMIDDAVQYVYTTFDSIPDVLLIAAAVLILQVYMANHAESFTSVEQRSDVRFLFLCIILGLTRWTGLCRLLRGEALKMRELDHVQAARALGVGHLTIIVRQILPNVMHLVLITVVMQFSGLVLAEAVLSYIGIGVDPGMQSWGNMINSARLELAREPVVWWSLAAAFCFMFVLVLAANLFADAVRDAFDPRIRRAG
jgi:peptide/nickel transport system permease protein